MTLEFQLLKKLLKNNRRTLFKMNIQIVKTLENYKISTKKIAIKFKRCQKKTKYTYFTT